MQTLPLTEHVDHWNRELTIDADQRLVCNVALAGALSRNGYRYAETALQQAAPLYRDKPVFLDHAPVRQRPLDRSTRDLVGSIQNPRYDEGRIRGDIRVLDTPSGATFLKLVESETPGVGMSHVVFARRSPDGQTVEQIADVVSVDVVVDPATTTTFRESGSIDEEYSPAGDRPLAELLAENAHLLSQRDELAREAQRLQQAIDRLAAREATYRLLAESGLPAEAVTESFTEQVLTASSSAARQRLIQDRLWLLRTFDRRRGARSTDRPQEVGTAAADDLFIRAIRG